MKEGLEIIVEERRGGSADRFKERAGRIISEHLASACGIVSVGNPLWAYFETQLMNRSPEVSFDSKVIGTIANFAGISYFYNQGRKCAMKLARIREGDKKKLAVVDTIYAGFFSMCYSMVNFSFLGERDAQELAKISLIAAGLNFFPMGIINGYAIDVAKDLFGVEKSNRIPRFLSEQKSYVKKAIGFSLAALSALGTYCYLDYLGK